MYKKVSTDMNFVEREKEVEKFWADNDIFRKSMKGREGKPMYTFYDGPPTHIPLVPWVLSLAPPLGAL